VAATPEGARLRCIFQKLEGQVTREGLWLTSTVTNTMSDRFRVKAVAVRRQQSSIRSDRSIGATPAGNQAPSGATASLMSEAEPLPPAGTISVSDNQVRFVRPGLVEEYSVSMDGVRQDFLVLERPDGAGPMRVELDVAGAKAEPLVNGARLVLDASRRKIAYSRLRATDAQGKELTATMAVLADTRLAVVVDDADASYPLRIDPTFSDDKWISMGGLLGANGAVYAAVVDSAGNLYIGGDFTVVGDVIANRIAKWNGSSWSALESGLNNYVNTLALSGSDLYVGGKFTTAGGSAANYVTKWNGSSWSALGSGVGGRAGDNLPSVITLAVSGSDLYAGGTFTNAGGSTSNCVAKWNGSSWSALGLGLGVDSSSSPSLGALAVSGGDLYVGGYFTTAGGSAANCVAKWNGSSWSALGSGLGGTVSALAMSGSDLYVGGTFTTAGGSAANNVAKWNGSSWSPLGSGMGGNSYPSVEALVLSGSGVYVGGYFTTAGGSAANNVAKWNGSSWSPLGSGMDYGVGALAVSGSDLYAGGNFTKAGGKVSASVARAIIGTAGGRFSSPVYSPATWFSCAFRDATPGEPYRIQASPSLALGSWTDVTNFTYTNPISITDPNSIGPTKRFYRAVWGP
jgi:hypothetical protein